MGSVPWWTPVAVIAAPIALAGGAVLVQSACMAYEAWRLRHIPGPRPAPLFGNIPEIVRAGGSQNAMLGWKAKYGPVFKIFFGARPFVVVADPDAARTVMNKLPNHAPFLSPSVLLMPRQYAQLDDEGLVQLRDGAWRAVRTAWQPAFAPGSLARYSGLMAECADALVQLLSRAANDPSLTVDIHDELNRMTLAVVGTCAYGVDFGSLESGQQAEGAAHAGGGLMLGGGGGAPLSAEEAAWLGPGLVAATKMFFAGATLPRSSVWGLPALLLPAFTGAVRALAAAFPDALYTAQLQARHTIVMASRVLIARWRTAHAAAASGATDAAAPAAPQASAGSTPAGAGDGQGGGGGGVEQADAKSSGSAGGGMAGVEAGSFLSLLLAQGAHKGGGGGGGSAALTDTTITAQAITFILAGTETTANALSFAVYLLTQNPEAEAALLAEVDAYGRDTPVTHTAALPYADAVVSEALRLYPPAHATSREGAKGEVQVGGYTVPPHVHFLVSLYANHMDPGIWPRAREFLPERWLPGSPLAPTHPAAFMPFGGGPRMCIGWKFALQEARIALVRLYQRYRFTLAPGVQVPLATVTGITLGPRHGLHVRVHTR